MNSRVAAQLNEKEREQLRQAFKLNWRRNVTASDLAVVVGSMVGGVLFVAAVLMLAVFLPGSLGQTVQGMLPIALPLFLVVHFVVVQRLYGLIRRLHDIAATALEECSLDEAAGATGSRGPRRNLDEMEAGIAEGARRL